jgi:phosphoribosylaminoimidazolecarboxamide formyltransferase/IMP cyclohydrolase
VASGGTADALEERSLLVTRVELVTEVPEMFGGRVKTLHPKIHGGILVRRDNPQDVIDAAKNGIEPFDLVVVNLYPFTETVASGASRDEIIEKIDVGGPAMLRAAAKNFAYVGAVCDPADYDGVVRELTESGELSDDTRLQLAYKAFAHTANYDAAISTWFAELSHPGELPPTIHVALEKAEDLAYGANPHQRGGRYRAVGARSWWDDVFLHQGRKLSHQNILDAVAGWQLVHDFLEAFGSKPTVAIVKHVNPCGFARADNLTAAYQLAYACDSNSAFGGVVAFSHPVDVATAQAMAQSAKADVVIAPGYNESVLDILRDRHEETRVLTAPPPSSGGNIELRQLSEGLWLVQDPPHFVAKRRDWQVVTERQPTDAQMDDAAMAWLLCDSVTSNSTVLFAGGVAWGIGAGQQNRAEAARIAVAKADAG